MKKLLILYCCFCSLLYVEAKPLYYYYEGERIPLSVSDDSIKVYTIDNIKTTCDGGKEFSYSSIVTSARGNDKDFLNGVSSKEYIILCDSGHTIQVSNEFYVQLYDPLDYPKLQHVAEETTVQIIGHVPYTRNWYKLVVNNSKIDNSLEMSNYFYETGLFKNVDPGFIFNFQPLCVSDSHYSSQWGLPAIHACDAWNISKGDTSILIAIVDKGVYTQHAEFLNTQFVYPYDCKTQDSLSYHIYGDHGTFIGGIIAADHNHEELAGIAPLCKIMPISHPLTVLGSPSEELASGISWAVAHGADVINCSWGDQDGRYYDDLHSTLLESSINDALTYGRNGKGCVVVFASGNQASSHLDYPAYVFPEILTVGAIDETYNRAYMSSMGPDLDIVAPGTNIYSTIANGGYNTDHGTSYAAPYASGVAGLMLSKNPLLTRQEVVDIIESTAQKISTGYSTYPNHPNGTWNFFRGYGLVDAYAAVLEAQNRLPKIQGAGTIFCTAENYHVQNLPPSASVRWSYETTIQQVDTFPILHLSDTTTASISVERGTYFLWGFDGLPLPDEPYVGYVTLKAAVTFNGTTRTFSKLINLRQDKAPTLPASSLRDLQLNETRTFSINNCPDIPFYDLIWEITLPQSTTPFTHHGSIWTTTTTQAGTLNIKLYNAENCNDTLHSEYNILVSKLKPFDPFPPDFIFPNPVTTNTVEIQVVDQSYATRGSNETAEERPAIDYTLELWDENYGLLKTVNSSISGEKDIVTLDLSNLRNGVYFLVLKVDNQIVKTDKLIINR